MSRAASPRWPLRVMLAALLAVPAMASAQVFKCEKGSFTVYQQQPCPPGERQTPVGKQDASPGWEGCYEGEVGTYSRSNVPTSLRVRRGARGLELTLDGEPEVLPLRAMTAEERLDLARSMDRKDGAVRVSAGIGVPVPASPDDPSRGGQLMIAIVRMQSEGREFLMFLAPITVGSVHKVPCKSP